MTGASLIPALTVAIPLIVAVIGGWFGYRQAVKVADRNVGVEGRKLTLAEYEALNKGLTAEIQRLREDAREDEEKLEKRIVQLEARLAILERQRSEETDRSSLMTGLLREHEMWSRNVLRILANPQIRAILRDREIDVPPPPSGVAQTVPGGVA